MSLAEAYKEYIDNGGQIAIRGYNFQAYVGVFLMLHLHKCDHFFEISFEKDDDISLKDLTIKESFKIQVKSEKLTPNKIVKTTDKEPKSILGKLLFNSDNYNYAILVFGQEKGDSIKEICKEESKKLGNTNYRIDWDKYENIKQEASKTSKKAKTLLNKQLNIYQNINNTLTDLNCSKEKLLFHEAPFTTASDNCLNYLCGYSPNIYEGTVKKIEMSENQILGILGSVYHSIDKSSQISKFDNKIFIEIEKQNEIEILINDVLDALKKDSSPFYIRKLKNNQADFIENRKIYENFLSEVVLPKYLLSDSFSKYLKENGEKIEKGLNKNIKNRINIFIIEWYIIYKTIEENL